MTRDAVIVGAGPVGLTLALLLARHGMRTTILERAEGPSDRAGAVSVDDECLRTWQACGLGDRMREVWDAGEAGAEMCRYLDARGRKFLSLRQRESDLGYPHAVVLRQQDAVRVLWDEAVASPSIDIITGASYDSHAQDDEGVIVRYGFGSGGAQSVCAPWLVACDGGRSALRRDAGISMEDIALPNAWLVADIENGHTEPFVEIRCGARPSVSVPLPGGLRRVELMLERGDDGGWASDEREVRRRLSPLHVDTTRLEVRSSTICRFRAGIVSEWSRGRVFVAGDAAHVTPPFAAQGLAAGIRDASNLSFKLAGVTQGWLPDDVLETYQAERGPHQEDLLSLALRLGAVMAPRSEMFGRALHTLIRAAWSIRPFRESLEMRGPGLRPSYRNGFVLPGGRAGTYLPQPRIRSGAGERGRLDDLLGPRMTWISLGDGTSSGRTAGVNIAPSDVLLVEGRDFFDETRTLQRVYGGGSLLLVRPDRIVHTHVAPRLKHSLKGRSVPCQGSPRSVPVCT